MRMYTLSKTVVSFLFNLGDPKFLQLSMTDQLRIE